MTRFPACDRARSGVTSPVVARRAPRREEDRTSPMLPLGGLTELTTLNGGSLGSWVDEERSKLRVDM